LDIREHQPVIQLVISSLKLNLFYNVIQYVKERFLRAGFNEFYFISI